MRKLFLILILSGGFSFGQFFDSEENYNDDHKTSEPQFMSSHDNGGGTPPPDQGEDGPGNPNIPMPIDDWIWLLPLVGITMGYYLLYHKKSHSG